MKHIATADFWKLFALLPKEVQTQAYKNYEVLKTNPTHPSLHFKQIDELWSVRVGISYRALAFREESVLYWFWIGSHAEYDKIIS